MAITSIQLTTLRVLLLWIGLVMASKPVNSSILDAICTITGIQKKIMYYMEVHRLSIFESMIHVTQQEWLRKPGTECWQLTGLHEDKSDQLLPLFTALGMCSEIQPVGLHYCYGLVLGSDVADTVARLVFLEKEIAAGKVTLEYLVFLTGQRVLEAKEIQQLKQYGLYADTGSTEADMMLFLLHHTSLVPNFKNCHYV